jgi:hypothetical protein
MFISLCLMVSDLSIPQPEGIPTGFLLFLIIGNLLSLEVASKILSRSSRNPILSCGK